MLLLRDYMSYNWLVVIPPLIVLALGFLTQRVLLSLIGGIVTASLIAAKGSLLAGFTLAIRYLWENLELANYTSWHHITTSQNSFIALFLCMLGIIVLLVQYSGGAHAYGSFVRNKLKNTRSAEIATLLLSSLIFVDDYFSTLTCGSVMRPLTDRFNVPRVKLAFLVNAMAAPLVILAPISSWVAAIIGFLGENGVSIINTPGTIILADPFIVYSRILPFIFYSVIMISATWFIVLKRISFGLIGNHEHIAQTTANLFGESTTATSSDANTLPSQVHTSLIDFLIPIITLFCSILGAIQYTGDSWIFGGANTIINAFRSANPYQGLVIAGIITLTITILFYLLRSKITSHQLPYIIYEGIQMMLPAIIMLMLAWTLGDILRVDLKTGVYLANLMKSVASITLLPVIFFVLSTITSMAIGTSWGAAALMFSIAIPMVVSTLGLNPPVTLDNVLMLLPVLGAVLAGAVAGNHLSPIADTTIMSSTSTGARHNDLIQGQVTYALPIYFATCCAFLATGFLANYGILIMVVGSNLIGILISLLLLTICNNNKKLP